MKCPYCGYHHGWDADMIKFNEGEKGRFYKFPIPMTRDGYWEAEQREVYGCPSCNKLFMEE